MTSYVIDYFELPTSSTATSSGFYARAFGWGDKPYGPGYSEILDAGVLGGLNSGDDKPAAPLIGIRTDDLVAAQAAVEAAGGTISVPAEDYPGGRRFQFREPGGAELLVYCPAE
jgi:predicted enzyme related to lactoylglutathione lyase